MFELYNFVNEYKFGYIWFDSVGMIWYCDVLIFYIDCRAMVLYIWGSRGWFMGLEIFFLL